MRYACYACRKRIIIFGRRVVGKQRRTPTPAPAPTSSSERTKPSTNEREPARGRERDRRPKAKFQGVLIYDDMSLGWMRANATPSCSLAAGPSRPGNGRHSKSHVSCRSHFTLNQWLDSRRESATPTSDEAGPMGGAGRAGRCEAIGARFNWLKLTHSSHYRLTVRFCAAVYFNTSGASNNADVVALRRTIESNNVRVGGFFLGILRRRRPLLFLLLLLRSDWKVFRGSATHAGYRRLSQSLSIHRTRFIGTDVRIPLHV